MEGETRVSHFSFFFALFFFVLHLLIHLSSSFSPLPSPCSLLHQRHSSCSSLNRKGDRSQGACRLSNLRPCFRNSRDSACRTTSRCDCRNFCSSAPKVTLKGGSLPVSARSRAPSRATKPALALTVTVVETGCGAERPAFHCAVLRRRGVVSTNARRLLWQDQVLGRVPCRPAYRSSWRRPTRRCSGAVVRSWTHIALRQSTNQMTATSAYQEPETSTARHVAPQQTTPFSKYDQDRTGTQPQKTEHDSTRKRDTRVGNVGLWNRSQHGTQRNQKTKQHFTSHHTSRFKCKSPRTAIWCASVESGANAPHKKSSLARCSASEGRRIPP